MTNRFENWLPISTCAAAPGPLLDAPQGWAVQVDPIKATLKAPGTKRLKLKSDELLSSFAFNFNMRRYSKGGPYLAKMRISFVVGWCRLTLSNPS
jgi:hypothetical protein